MFTHPNTTMTTIMRSISSEQRECFTCSNTNTLNETSSNNPSTRASYEGPVAILWDIENCPVPRSVRPEDVGGNIRLALQVHPMIKGAVTMFSAYGDFNSFPKRLREGCQRTGVKLIDVPGGRKDAADKAILVDMFLFALDNPPPSTIMLISGDVDFASALHILGQRGYTVILVIPTWVNVSSALLNAGKFVWDWKSVSHGEGFVPSSTGYHPGLGNSFGCHSNSESVLGSYYNSRDFSIMSHSVSSSDPTLWVQPGDLNGLKGQIVKLLEVSGGLLLLYHVPSEYQRLYGRHLKMSEYGVNKLFDLLARMEDMITVFGKGKNRLVCIRNWKMGLTGPSEPQPLILARRDVDNVNVLSNQDRAEIEAAIVDQMFEQFRCEVHEILVSYSCRIAVESFEEIYELRYKKPIEYHKYGVDRLEDLLEKVGGVVVLHGGDKGGTKKFLSVDG